MSTHPSAALVRPFRKILIANRGEIACRVIRTARKLGYRTVAVFSEADAASPHVALADEAVCVGAPAAAQSYLNVAAILGAAQRTGADAIHPGYGFLSENASFAAACAEAGLVFIGPSSSATEAMGSKARAKHLMMQAGVPCVPGYLGRLNAGSEHEPVQDEDARLLQEGESVGFPLLVKAVAGGGGRGMRLVHALSELPAALASARREASSTFGDGTLMLERLIERGRHIEIQVFADAHGHAVHLGERDCTAQRRRQKVIEEAPSPVVSPAMREAMGRDAVAAALAVGYCGAGTVEFIVDADMRHYFLEMNTRLQVEHPVTELITGLDLVEWQLRVASGEPLPLAQADIRLTGHAIEARLYAEDPYSRPTAFAPQTGAVLAWPAAEVATRGGIRIDAGIAMGEGADGTVAQVSPHYDAMVAKVMAYGRDREDAIRRLRAALQDAPLIGLRGNARFLSDLLAHPAFAQAQMHTALIDEWVEQGEPVVQEPMPPGWLWAVAAACLGSGGSAVAPQASPLGQRGVSRRSLTLACGEASHTLALALAGSSLEPAAPQVGAWQVSLPAALQEPADAEGSSGIQGHRVKLLHWQGSRLQVEVDGVQRRLIAHRHAVLAQPETVYLVDQGHPFAFERVSAAPKTDAALDASRALAPVAGLLTQLSVQVGQTVQAGQALACVEAMKMEMWVHAVLDARVLAVHGEVGKQVAAGTVLVELEPLSSAAGEAT